MFWGLGFSHAVASFLLIFPGLAQTSPAPSDKPPVTIMPFAVADGTPAGAEISRAACPAQAADIQNTTPDDQASVVAAITSELQEKLGEKFSVQTVAAGAALSNGTIAIVGCIVQMDGGNAKKRVIGAGMGASSLKAHVQVIRIQDSKPTVLQEFDEESKGRNFGVGSGMVINAMRSHRTSLAGDAGNLADKVAKAFEKQQK